MIDRTELAHGYGLIVAALQEISNEIRNFPDGDAKIAYRYFQCYASSGLIHSRYFDDQKMPYTKDLELTFEGVAGEPITFLEEGIKYYQEIKELAETSDLSESEFTYAAENLSLLALSYTGEGRRRFMLQIKDPETLYAINLASSIFLVDKLLTS